MNETTLVADIGGTNARFATAIVEGASIRIEHIQQFRAEDFESPNDAARAYLEVVGRVSASGCFAVAAPVSGNKIEFTNSSWVLDAAELKKSLSLESLKIINDYQALAAGIAHLPEDSFRQIKEGVAKKDAPVVVIGPGTGLGQALIVPTGNRQHIVATQGGHVAFAPETAREIEVLKFIAREHPRVSVERLLSGQGLVNIYKALCTLSGIPYDPLQADEITKAATIGKNPLTIDTVNMFCAILGGVTGDAVLSAGAQGGVVLGGGILPRIQEVLLASNFSTRFQNKGRLSDYVADVPVRLIMAEGAALFGAAASMNERPDND